MRYVFVVTMALVCIFSWAWFFHVINTEATLSVKIFVGGIFCALGVTSAFAGFEICENDI